MWAWEAAQCLVPAAGLGISMGQPAGMVPQGRARSIQAGEAHLSLPTRGHHSWTRSPVSGESLEGSVRASKCRSFHPRVHLSPFQLSSCAGRPASFPLHQIPRSAVPHRHFQLCSSCCAACCSDLGARLSLHGKTRVVLPAPLGGVRRAPLLWCPPLRDAVAMQFILPKKQVTSLCP